jgi:hypothetical protein
LSSPTPADRAAPRFRLPVEPPTRQLLIGSLATIAGGCQLFAWALARLPIFFLFLGVVLVLIGLGFGLAALVRHYRLRWIAYVGDDSLTLVNGQRRTVLPWSEVGGVRYSKFRLQVTGDDGDLLSTLQVDRTREAHEAAQTVQRVISAHVRART